MKRKFLDRTLVWIYVCIVSLFLLIPLLGNYGINVFSDHVAAYNTVIIDAGHGGIDGGAISCTGAYESQINLEISKRLNDLMHLMGMRTIMIRDTDRSVYTEGNTIAAKKVSDIKQRLKIVNSTPNALFISIHQNNFTDARYYGTQVFHNANAGSKELAEQLQSAFRKALDPSNRRQIKQSSGVYLMEHINCTGVLIECGFLSNQKEEAMLRDSTYQKKLCCVMSATVSQYLNA